MVLDKSQECHWRPQKFLISGNFLKGLIPAYFMIFCTGDLKKFSTLIIIFITNAYINNTKINNSVGYIIEKSQLFVASQFCIFLS